MTVNNDIATIRNKDVKDLRADAYRTELTNQKIQPEVIDKLLEDKELGGNEDIKYLESRQDPKSEVPKSAKEAELPLLNSLKALEPSADVKSWSDGSTYKAPKATLEDIENGKATLKKGDGGPVVGEVQNLLKNAGFEEKKYGADQRFGSATEAKVKEFQSANGLEPTGQVDKGTLTKLQAATQTGKKEETDKAVRAERDAASLRTAIDAKDSNSISGILARQNESSMKQMKAAYDAKNGDGALTRDLGKATSDKDAKAVWSTMINPPERSKEPASMKKAGQDFFALDDALRNSDATTASKIISRSTPEQLRMMDDFGRERVGRGIYDRIWRSGVSKEANRSLRLLANGRMAERNGDPKNDAEAAKRDAQALKWAMDGFGTDEDLVSFVLSKQSPESMKQVRDAFDAPQAEGPGGLDRWIRGDESGSTEKLWLAMANRGKAVESGATLEQDVASFKTAVKNRDMNALMKLLGTQPPGRTRQLADALKIEGLSLDQMIANSGFKRESIVGLRMLVQQRLAEAGKELQ